MLEYPWTTALHSWIDHPLFEKAQTRRWRRLIVVSFLVCLAGFPLLAWQAGNYRWSLPLLIPFTALLILLDGSTRGMMVLPDPALDERQRQQRDTWYRVSYWTGALIGFGGGVIVMRLLAINAALGAGMIVCVIGLLIGLPAMVAAWTQPDEVLDEG